MGIAGGASPNQTTQPGPGDHGSARNVSLNATHSNSFESSQGENEDFLDSVIQKNLRNFLAGHAAVNGERTASAKPAIEITLPVNDAKGVREDLTGDQDENPNNVLIGTRAGASLDIDCDQVIWDTDSSRGVEDADGDIVLEDAPNHLLDRVPSKGDGLASPAIAKQNNEALQKPQSKGNAPLSQIEMPDSGDSVEEGEIVTLRRAFSRSRNTISGNMTGSPAHMDPNRPSYYRAFAAPPSASDISPKRRVRRPASVCRLNIPRELLANLHQDPRFDKYCHAWISRPDFCGRGDECYYVHMYPPGTVEEFGILTLDIDSNGSVLNGQDGGAEQRESRWSRYLLPGRQEYTPGCYDRICKDFERNVCRRGAECWYQHSTDPGVIRRRHGVVWKGRVDSKIDTIANAHGSFVKPHRRSDYPGQTTISNNLNYYGYPLGRADPGLPRSEAVALSCNHQDNSRTISPPVKSWEEASIANWNAAAYRNAREYAGQQERLTCLNQEWQRRRTDGGSTNSTASTTKPIKSQEVRPKQSFFSTDREGFRPFTEESLLVRGERNGPICKQACENPHEGSLISFLC